jgi:hypothetical protein
MTLVVHQSDVGEALREPIKLSRRRRRLSTVVMQQPRQKGRPYVVSVHRRSDFLRDGERALQLNDDVVRLRSKWKTTLVGPDDVVVITYLPLGGMNRGGQGGGKQIGMAIAMLALTIVAPMLVGAIGGPMVAAGGGLSLLGKIVSAGIVMGAGYFLSKATKPKANDTDDRPVYGVSGGGNVARPGDRIPVHYGKCWSNPDLSQPDFFIYDGEEDQILYKRVTVGLGDYTIHELRVGQATMFRGTAPTGRVFKGNIAPFTAAEIEVIRPGERSTLVPSSIYSAEQVAGLELPEFGENPAWAGPFRVTPAGETTKRIQIDFSAPNGIYATHPKKSQNLPAVFGGVWQYAEIDDDGRVTGDWKNLLTVDQQMTTTRAKRVTKFINVPEGAYAVRGRSINAPSDQYEQEGARIIDTMYWDGLRGWLDKEPERPEVTELAIKVKATKAVGNMSFADIWVRHTRKLPVFNGLSWTEPQETRKAVWAALDIIRNKDYGNASPDSKIDIATFLHYANTVTENDTFDGTIRGPVPVAEAVGSVLGVIRAEPVLVGDVWSMSRDEPQDFRKHVITRRQIVRDTSGADFDMDLSDGSADVIVEYYVEGDPRRRAEWRETIGERTITPRRIQAFGITTHEHAVMLAKWYAAAAYYRREHRLFTTELMGRNLGRNETALIDLWFLDKTKAAGVEARSGLTITLDADVELPAGAHAVFRDEKGQEWGPVAASPTADPRVITVSAGDVAVVENWTGRTFASLFSRGRKRLPMTVLLGTILEVTQPYIIRTARPQDMNTCQISAVIDAPEVWQVLGEAIPPGPPIAEIVLREGDLAPILPYVRANVVQKATALVLEWSAAPARGANRYQVWMSYSGGTDEDNWEKISDGPSMEGSYVIEYRPNVEARVRAVAVNDQGIPSEPVYATASLFKPILDGEIAQMLIELNMLQEQLKRDIEAISKIGEENLAAGRLLIRNQVRALEKRLEDLAEAAATEASQAYESRELVKVALDGRSNEFFAAIQEETNLRISEDEALAERITTLSGQLGEDLSAALQEEMRVRVTADEALAEDITTLDTRMTTAEGNLTGQSTAVASLTSRTTQSERRLDTQASQITGLESRITTAEGTVSGQATSISNITTRVSNAEGRITSEASRVDTLSSTVGGHTSTITQHTSSINGVQAEWGIAWTHDGNAVGGIRLTGMKNLRTGAPTVEFGVSGNLVVTGTIWGDKLAANNIITASAQIGALTVDTINVADGAISHIEGVNAQVDESEASVVISVRPGSKVAVIALFKAVGPVSFGASHSSYFRLYRSTGGDATLLTEVPTTSYPGGAGKVYQPTTQMFIDRPGAGSHRYVARNTITGGVNLICIELAK